MTSATFSEIDGIPSTDDQNNLKDIEAEKAFLLSIESLGMSASLLELNERFGQIVGMAAAARWIMSADLRPRKHSRLEMRKIVKEYPALFSMLPEDCRDVSWLTYRHVVFGRAMISIDGTANKMSDAEKKLYFKRFAGVYPYPFELIPLEHQIAENVARSINLVREHELSLVNFALVTEENLRKSFKYDYPEAILDTPAAKRLGHIKHFQ